MTTSRATLLLLTEDSGRDSHATHEALLRSMLRLLGPRHVSSAIAIESANDDQRSVMRNNGWDSTTEEDEPARRALIKSIATRLCQSNLHVVLFHYDGDRPWADRDGCTRHAVFERRVVTPITQHPKFMERTPEQRSKALARLVRIVPFYSVEAWLYQNTAVAVGLCEKHHGGRHVETIQRWSEDRASLDELSQPKKTVCLSDKFNRELATHHFPANDVYAAGKSFHAAVETLRGCADLVGLLTALTPSR